MIYFDNSATTIKKPKQVIEAVLNAMTTAGNASRGLYDESLNSDRIVFATRQKIAKLFNVSNARQVVFTKNSTEALNIAIKGLINPGEHIITSVTEHNSVLRPLNYISDIKIDYIQVDSKGNLLYEQIEKFIRKDTKAIVLNHASNVTGNINDIRSVGQICKKNDIIFIVDASQTAGAFEIDMEKMCIDVLCFTGHKSMLAPQGTGGLCVREGLNIRPFIVGGTGSQSYLEFQPSNMPDRLEAGTLNVHGLAGLGSAIDYINEHNMEVLTEKAQLLSRLFYDECKNLSGLKFYGDYENKFRAPIISLNIFDKDSAQISMILSEKYNIATRPKVHCAPLLHKAMNTVNQGMVRFSFSHTNTKQEVIYAVNAIKEIVDSFI